MNLLKNILFLFLLILSCNCQTVWGQCTDESTHTINSNDQWISCQMTTSPNPSNGMGHWVMYDLGYVYNLAQTTFWNYNVTGQTNLGFKDIVIDVSTDGTNWIQAAQFQLPQATGQTSYPGFQGPDLNEIAARYVLIFSQNNWGTGTCAGFSEFKATVDSTPCINGDLNQDGICDFVEVNMKVLLEGAIGNNSTNEMKTTLANNNLIPLSQPYNTAPYNFANATNVPLYPSNTVDWILVEARTGTPAISGTPQTNLIERQVGFLDKNGNILHSSGNGGLQFYNLLDGNSYYFTVRHRNHLDVFTANSLTINNLQVVYDFTTSSNQAFGSNQLKNTPNGSAFMMHAGDYDHNGVIQISDFDLWTNDPAVLMIYSPIDGNLDGTIQTTDYDQWFVNKAKLGIAEIQY